jgi:hypothetical protein
VVLGISLLLCVPALRPVLREVRDISPMWIMAAVALELASSVSFVIGGRAAARLVLGYSIGYLANTTPIPGGIGVLDAGLSGALLLYGAAPAHVVAAVLVYHAIALWIPSVGGLIAYARLRPHLTDPSSARPPASSLTHTSHLLHQEASHERPPADPQTDRPWMGRLPDRRPRTRSLPRPWFRVARAALPRQRHEGPADPI